MNKKIAIVTGASSGIGLGVTLALLDRGYRVVAVARDPARARQLRTSADLAIVAGDVGKRATAERAAAAARDFGGLDLLVNNAGVFMAKPFTDYAEDDFALLMSTNVAGFFHMTQQALGLMTAGKGGHIVNISTSLATQPVAGVPSALAVLTKGGIEAAARSLAIEYAAQGIRVNTIAAGITDTPMHAAESHEFLRGLSPAKRIATVQEMADAVLYLDSAAFVSGEILHVDGGAHAGKWS